MAGQTVADLRTLVTRRVGLKRRVAVLGSDLALIHSVQNNGCEVLVDPASLDELSTFRPDVVVAFDGFATGDGRGAFAMLAKAAPQAEVVFSFAHAGSATAALTALLGASPVRSFAERDVTAWLTAEGYAVTSRDLVVEPHTSVDLSADTEAALRQLFEQLNPQAAADRLLLVARRGPGRGIIDRTPGLLSVVISAGQALPALEGTVASLLASQQRPIELVLSSALSLEHTDRVFAQARARAGVTCVTTFCTSTDWAARTNAGLVDAHGQYLACIEAGDLFSPFHFSTLVKRLADGTKAWALGAAQPELPPVFSMHTWLTRAATHRAAYVIDSARTATVPLSFAEGVWASEAMRFVRLAALFEPAWVTGPASFETLAQAPVTPEALVDALRARPLRVLTTLQHLMRSPEAPRLRALISTRMRALVDQLTSQ